MRLMQISLLVILSEVHGAPNKETKNDADASMGDAEVTGLKCTSVRGGRHVMVQQVWT